MKLEKWIVTLFFILLSALPAAGTASAAPNAVNYQGVLYDSGGVPVPDQPFNMIFRIYDAATGGTILYEESQSVATVNGIYDVLLGTGTVAVGTFDPALFSSDNRWLEVVVNAETLTPRQQVTSVAFSLQAQEATHAAAADNAVTLAGQPAAAYDQSAHLTDYSNPHKVTAAQVGTLSKLELDDLLTKHTNDSSAHHVKTTTFPELTGQIANAQIPAIIARDTELTWNKLAGKPAGFADNVDNDCDGAPCELASSLATNCTQIGADPSGVLYCSPDNGVPSGFQIMGQTPTPPPGFSYTGITISNNGFGWRARADMPIARSELTAVAMNNHIYAIGGWPFGTEVDEYDPVYDNWTVKSPMPTSRSAFALAVVNNKIYAIGGLSGSAINQNEEYDPATDSWSTKAPMPTARYRLAAAVVNNKIYVMGGTGGTSTVEVYDPVTDTWATKTPMPTGHTGCAAVAVNNKIYILGGGGGTTSTEEYDPVSDTWSTKAPMQNNRMLLGAAVVNNRIYAIGGVSLTSGNPPLDSNEEYDPLADSWQSRPPLPSFIQGHAVASTNGRIYVIGGAGGGLTLKSMEEYTPPKQQFYVHVKN